MVSHPWSPITDLPDDWEGLARPDLDEILRLWNEERQHLADPDRARQLEERLATLWAIETGVIERLYTIDRGTTESLVNLGLGAIEQFSTTGRLTQNAASLIEDQRAALDFVFTFIRDDRPLTQSYIRELHQLLMRNQTHVDAVDQFGNRFQAQAQRGIWKTSPNNPTTVDGSIHEYAPVDFVQDEMDQLIAMHQRHMERGVRPEVEAAWLHHRFAQIHPFQDGNGRVARALATMMFLKAGYVPLVVRDDDHRERYLDALSLADAGDLKPLVDLFANIVSRDLDDAITFVRTMHGRPIKAIAAAAAEAAKRHATLTTTGVVGLTERFSQVAHTRLVNVGQELSRAFDDALKGSLRTSMVKPAETFDTGPNMTWSSLSGVWRQQTIDAAHEFGYSADLSQHRRAIVLALPDASPNSRRWYVVVSFHHKARRTGTMAAALFLTSADDLADSANRDATIIPGSSREFTYSGSYPQDERFRAWLDAAITNALEAWQARL
jgi:Fic family protein